MKEETMMALQPRVRQAARRKGRGMRDHNFRRVSLMVLAALVYTLPAVAQTGAKGGEWRFYAGDGGSTKYSALDQINRDNVKNLKIAWRWKTDNFGPSPEFLYEATPLMINGVLY